MSDDQTDFEPQIYDGDAQIAPPVSADKHSRMSPERQAIYDNLHAAIANERTKDQAIKDAMAAIKAAQIFADKKQEALTALTGKITFHTLWKRDIARQERNPDDPEKLAAIAAAQAEHHTAMEAVQICQQAYQTARHAVVPARAMVANCLRAYQSRYPVKSAATVHKEHIASLQAHKLAGRLAAEPERHMASNLDAYLQGGRGQPGVRSARQGQRGAFPSHMRGQSLPTAAPPAPKPPVKP